MSQFPEGLPPPPPPGISNLTSPTRLARLATAVPRDSTITRGLWGVVNEQCRQRRSLEPLYRFLEAVLSEFFENPATTAAVGIMGVDDPEIFNITVRAKANYASTREFAFDVEYGNQYNIKILQYLLRVVLSDYRLYHPATSTLHIDDTARLARKNIARLFSHLDLIGLLPTPPLGIVRREFPLGPFPLPDYVRLRMSSLSRQRSSLEEILGNHELNYVVYTSAFGITNTVALPTFTVVLNSLTSTAALQLIASIRPLFDPFTFSTTLVRLVEGAFMPAGRVWYYSRVPLSNSISVHVPLKDPTAGTLGCYCANASNDQVLGLTAGHVLAESADGIVSAPAGKPYAEAVKSIDIRVVDEQRRQTKDQKKWLDMQLKLKSCNRRLGTILLEDIESVDGERFDLGVIAMDPSRCADNRLGKIPAYRVRYSFSDEGDKLSWPENPYKVGESVVKAGIRTGLTVGTIIDKVSISWDLGTSTEVKCACHAVLGRNEDGMAAMFADSGDSGSALVRLIREADAPVEEEAMVVKSEIVGIVFAIVQEREAGPYVATFMPIESVMARIREKLQFDISMEVEDRAEEDWVYEELGKGISMFDLK